MKSTNPPSVKPAKHTPGPWRTADAENGMPAIRSCEGAPKTVAFIDVRFPNLVTPEERLANALLIAAAPELLEACREALSMFEVQLQLEAEDDETCVLLRKAIAKATSTQGLQ